MIKRAFATKYRPYLKSALKGDRHFGYDVRKLAKVEPLLAFLYNDWWRVNFTGLERLPSNGPALIAGNTSGLLPWPAAMLAYALMQSRENPRRLNIVADLDWVEDENLYRTLVEIGFVPWSSANIKRLFAAGELVAIFPEGLAATTKPFTQRYRLMDFDWTQLLPAVEENVPIFPLATLGCDEAVPSLGNLPAIARLIELPAFPITPFFPWFPFPLNIASLPVKWTMSILKNDSYVQSDNRDNIEETAKSQSRFVEGEIQAELNRGLRKRIKSY